jgi:UDP-N-acetylglucosamine pyrophosphorylase
MDMKRRGVTLLCSYPVDNILVRVADPLFVGFSIKKDLDISCKVVSKAYPTERVGVLALKGDRPAVIEYSEIDPERATAVDPTTGQLVYNASHLGLNNFSVRFIEKLVSPEGGRLHELPFVFPAPLLCQLTYQSIYRRFVLYQIPYCQETNPLFGFRWSREM